MKKIVLVALFFCFMIIGKKTQAYESKTYGPYLIPNDVEVIESANENVIFGEKNGKGYYNYLGKEFGPFPVKCSNDEVSSKKANKDCLYFNANSLSSEYIKKVNDDYYFLAGNLLTKELVIYKNNNLLFSYNADEDILNCLLNEYNLNFSVNKKGEWLISCNGSKRRIVFYNGKVLADHKVSDEEDLVSYSVDAEDLTVYDGKDHFKIVDNKLVKSSQVKEQTNATSYTETYGELKVERTVKKDSKEVYYSTYKVYLVNKLLGEFNDFVLARRDYETKVSVNNISQIVATFSKNKKWYIYNRGEIIGPFDNINYIKFSDKRILYSTTDAKNNRQVWLDKKLLGTYKDGFLPLSKDEEELYGSLRPSDGDILNADINNDNWFYSFKKDNKLYFNVNNVTFLYPGNLSSFSSKGVEDIALSDNALYLFNSTSVYKNSEKIANCNNSEKIFFSESHKNIFFHCSLSQGVTQLYKNGKLLIQSDSIGYYNNDSGAHITLPFYKTAQNKVYITTLNKAKDGSGHELLLTEIPIDSAPAVSQAKKIPTTVSTKNLLANFKFGQKFTTKFQGHTVAYEKKNGFDWFTIDGKKFGPYEYILDKTVDWNDKGWVFAAYYKNTVSLIANGKEVLKIKEIYPSVNYNFNLGLVRVSSNGKPVYSYYDYQNKKMFYVGASGKKYQYDINCSTLYDSSLSAALVYCGYINKFDIVYDDNKVVTKKIDSNLKDIKSDSLLSFGFAFNEKANDFLFLNVYKNDDDSQRVVVYRNEKIFKIFNGNIIKYGFLDGKNQPYLIYADRYPDDAKANCFVYINNKEYGPYANCGDIDSSDKQVAFNYRLNSNSKYGININGKEYLGGILSQGFYNNITADKYCLDCNNNIIETFGKWNGGYSLAVCAKALFNIFIDNDGKYYVYANGKKIGPYKFAGFVNCQSEKDWQYVYVKESDVGNFYIKTSQADYGPFLINKEEFITESGGSDKSWYYAISNMEDYSSSILANDELLDKDAQEVKIYSSSNYSKHQSVLVIKGKDYYKIFQIK